MWPVREMQGPALQRAWTWMRSEASDDTILYVGAAFSVTSHAVVMEIRL